MKQIKTIQRRYRKVEDRQVRTSVNQAGNCSQRELLSEKEVEKDVLVFTVQILSPVRFHTQPDHQTVHLCKQPLPLQPGPEILTRTHMWTENTTHTPRQYKCVCVYHKDD